MHSHDTYHLSLALIDCLGLVVARVHMHDRKLARRLRNTAGAIALHVTAGEPARINHAHQAAAQVLAILDVAQAWGYVHPHHIADAEHTARTIHQLTTP